MLRLVPEELFLRDTRRNFLTGIGKGLSNLLDLRICCHEVHAELQVSSSDSFSVLMRRSSKIALEVMRALSVMRYI